MIEKNGFSKTKKIENLNLDLTCDENSEKVEEVTSEQYSPFTSYTFSELSSSHRAIRAARG